MNNSDIEKLKNQLHAGVVLLSDVLNTLDFDTLEVVASSNCQYSKLILENGSVTYLVWYNSTYSTNEICLRYIIADDEICSYSDFVAYYKKNSGWFGKQLSHSDVQLFFGGNYIPSPSSFERRSAHVLKDGVLVLTYARFTSTVTECSFMPYGDIDSLPSNSDVAFTMFKSAPRLDFSLLR